MPAKNGFASSASNKRLPRIEYRIVRRVLDQLYAVFAVAAVYVALTAPGDLFAIARVVDPIPVAAFILTLPITRIGNCHDTSPSFLWVHIHVRRQRTRVS